MATGTVKFFNTDKGYGFIKSEDGGPDVVFHARAVERSGLALQEAMRIGFDVVPNNRAGKSGSREPAVAVNRSNRSAAALKPAGSESREHRETIKFIDLFTDRLIACCRAAASMDFPMYEFVWKVLTWPVAALASAIAGTEATS